MSDGRRLGAPDSSTLSDVAAATEKQMPSALQPRLATTEGSSQPVNSDKRNKDPGLHEQDNNNDSSCDDDDPLLQELTEELEQRTLWDSNLSKRQQTEIHQPSSRQSYDARIAMLMEKMDEEQMNRFEAFRRSTLSRANMKKLVSSLINQTLSDEKVNIVLCSLGKMFVCDLIETARRIAEESGEKVDALTRSHVFQAYRILKKKKLIKRGAGRFFSNL